MQFYQKLNLGEKLLKYTERRREHTEGSKKNLCTSEKSNNRTEKNEKKKKLTFSVFHLLEVLFLIQDL